MKKILTIMPALCFVLLVSAQEKKEPPPKEIDVRKPADSSAAGAPLPKIDLPEFVITGSEKIDLDVSSKAEEDEDRTFVPERPTPGVRNLAAEGGLSPKQTKPFDATPEGMNGKVFAGMGFYLTPQFDGWFGQHDRMNSFIVTGNYASSEGHVTNAGWWRGGFGAKGKYVIPDSAAFLPYAQMTGGVEYGRESYRAYGSAAPARTRDLSSLDISVGAGSRYALPYRSISGLDYSGSVGFTSYAADDSGKASEQSISLQGNATTRFFGSSFHGLVEYRATAYSMRRPDVVNGHWFALKADGMSLVGQSLQLSYALQQFIYRGNAGVTSGRFYPQVELRYFLTEDATAYVGFAPVVERNTLEALIGQNRYIDFNAVILPADVQADYVAGVDISPLSVLTAKARLSYRQTDHFATFLDTSGAKVWEVSYLSGVRSLQADCSLLYRLNDRQNVTAFITYRSAEQKGSPGMLPFIPAVTVGAVYHQFFDVGLHVEAMAEYVSSRYTDAARSHSTAGFVYTEAKADIGLFGSFRGYAELQNALDQHYYIWDGYRERTMYLMLGISYNW